MNNPLAKWDELEIIRKDAQILFSKKPSRKSLLDFIEYLDYIFCTYYDYGWEDAEKVVGSVPKRNGLDDKAVNLVIDGKTFRDRISEDSTPEEVIRIIETEAHRDYNTGVFDAAKESGKSGIRKKWYTMMDDRVRDTHDYLHGVTVGLDDAFYTYDGDSAMFPGGFTLPQNNVNCRCFVLLEA